MLAVAGFLRADFLDRLGERQAVRKAGQAVAKHLGTKGALGLHLDGAVDQRQQASRLVPAGVRQWRQFDLEIARRGALAVAELEVGVGFGRIREEGLQKVGDGAAAQAFGAIPVERAAGGALDRLAESIFGRRHREDIAAAVENDRGRDRKRCKQGAVIRTGKVRDCVEIVRQPVLFLYRQAVSGGLHTHGMAVRS
jgi:hypothetical protein